MNTELQEMKQYMEITLRMASELIKSRIQAEKQTKKGAFDYVTAVDLQVQEFIRKRLQEKYPQVDFLGEEQSEYSLGSRELWILDPIDGTTNFMHDYRCSAISLAYVSEGQVLIGMIYQPYGEEMFSAIKGEGA